MEAQNRNATTCRIVGAPVSTMPHDDPVLPVRPDSTSVHRDMLRSPDLPTCGAANKLEGVIQRSEGILSKVVDGHESGGDLPLVGVLPLDLLTIGELNAGPHERE